MVRCLTSDTFVLELDMVINVPSYIRQYCASPVLTFMDLFRSRSRQAGFYWFSCSFDFPSGAVAVEQHTVAFHPLSSWKVIYVLIFALRSGPVVSRQLLIRRHPSLSLQFIKTTSLALVSGTDASVQHTVTRHASSSWRLTAVL